MSLVQGLALNCHFYVQSECHNESREKQSLDALCLDVQQEIALACT